MTTQNHAAETKGDLKITYSDGRVEIVQKCDADRSAGEIVKPPREDDLVESEWAPISSGLMLTDPEDEDD